MPLADGTRSALELASALQDKMRSRDVKVSEGGSPITDPLRLAAICNETFRSELKRYARLGLLV